MAMATNLLAEDLDHVLAHTRDLWEKMRGARLFITGGTGFFGCWLIESLLWANDELDLGLEAHLLTRNPEAFRAKAPHLADHPALRFHVGDVKSFVFPDLACTHVIHAATEACAKLNEEDGLQMVDTIVEGTRRTLEFARVSGAREILFVSSGGIYGKQSPEVTHVPEAYAGAPDPMAPGAAYGEGKRLAELLCSLYHRQFGMDIKIARCFAFVGPHLPLDKHFAIGNFIRDGMSGGPLQVGGDGTPCRSYLYAADLAIWLWTILHSGAACRPYNVGSEAHLTIAELAHAVAECFEARPDIRIAQTPTPGAPISRYVPSTRRADAELGLKVRVDLHEAISRTLRWHRALGRH